MMDIRENVINDVMKAMSPLLDTLHLQMMEVAVRNASMD